MHSISRFRSRSLALTLTLAGTLCLVTACSDDAGSDDTGSDASTETGGDTPEPRDYYDAELSAELGAASNEARCSTCHSADGTLTGFSGESMQDIAFKDSYKGDPALDLLGAVNACVTGWMGGAALAADDAEFLALVEFFEGISDASATTPNPLEPEVLADEAAYEMAYAGGDALAGEAKYATSCAVCHDAGLTVGSVAAYPKATLASYTVGRIAQKVRTSGPPPSGTNDPSDTTPGPMPFFEPEELSAADLADIIAYVKAG